MRLLITFLTCFILISCASTEENWPAAAGPNGSFSVSSAKTPPVDFSVTDNKNILWKCDLPEGGQSGIAVWGNRVFLTIMKPVKDGNRANLKGADIVAICVDADQGKVLWEHPMKGVAKSPYMYGFSDSSSPGPVTDGKKVWFTNASGLISCLDFEGKVVWERKFKPVEVLDKVRFPFNKQFEPFMHGNTIVNMEPYWEKDDKRTYGWNYLFGINKDTGKTEWVSEDGLTHYNMPFATKGKVLIGRGAHHKVPEAPKGYSMIDLNNGKRVWQYETAQGMAMYTSTFNEKYALWYTEKDNLVHVLNPADGKLVKKVNLSENVTLRTHNGKSWDKKEGVSIKKEFGVNVFPAWYSNILIGDKLFFMCFQDDKKKAGPKYYFARVDLKTDKVELLHVPVHNNPGGEPIWNKPLHSDTKNTRGFDVAQDKRSKRDGWWWCFNGNPIAVNGKLYFTTMIGCVYCFDSATADFDGSAFLSLNDLGPLGTTWSVNTPSYANGRLYHRTLKQLICIGK